MPKILIVEDNYHDFAIAKGILLTEFPEASVEHIMTESRFRQWLNDEAASPPDLIILDVMLPWAEPSPAMEPRPKELDSASYMDAALRCYDLLKKHPNRSQVPVLILTVRDRFICPAGASCLHKTERARLNEVARQLLAKSATQVKLISHKVFISYARKDREKYRWFDEIWRVLETTIQGSSIQLWDDCRLLSGEWRPQIEYHMSTSTAALFLASIEFCTSPFIRDVEMAGFLDLRIQNGVKIFWVAVSACPIASTPLVAFQCLNDPAYPLEAMDRPHRNRSLVQIASRLAAQLVEDQRIS